MSAQYQKVVDTVDKYLKSPGPVNDYASKIEKLTGVKRIYIAQGLIFGLRLILLFLGANFISGFRRLWTLFTVHDFWLLCPASLQHCRFCLPCLQVVSFWFLGFVWT